VFALTYSAPAGLQLARQHPTPVPASGEALIRVTLAGICATDLEILRGYMQFAGVPGHEFVGVVEQGPPHLRGQRVVGEINCVCHACALCRRGLPTHCRQRTVLGIAGRDGAFAEYLVLPAENCHVVPAAITDQQAVFTELLAAAAHVRDAVPLEPEARVAVLGAGRLGLLVAQVLALTPVRLDVLIRSLQREALGARLGLHMAPAATADAGAYDVVVDCTGAADGLAAALRLCRPGGAIVLKSTYAGAAGVDLAPLVVNEVRVIGSRCGPFVPALELLATGRIHVDELVSAVYPLAAGPAALAAAGAPGALKVLLRPESS
jgi:2-desacetyl-2-hydroxyethyl bacteriochlorophyllide A dehydrogenase